MNHILMVTSYPPRECGIATYSQDLINAINLKFSNSFAIDVCALDESDIPRNYPPEVKYTLRTANTDDYRRLAREINEAPDIKDVFIQHEFGLFGGDYGEYLLVLLSELIKPVVITFHTVLPDPEVRRREVVATIAGSSANIIVMTNNSKDILIKDYGVSEEKITVIPHGTHLVPFNDREELKRKYGLTGKMVLSTFGLLGPNKSIDTAIEALPAIMGAHPDVVYLVLGKTHPGVVKNEGEIYRSGLEKRVKELNISDHVIFVNKYLSLGEIISYLKLTDIYLFTSKDPNQAVSGTFSYALSCGCPVISTPIPHARELLGDGTGMFFDFQDSGQLASAVIELLGDPQRRNNMMLNAIHQTNPMVWENVVITHAKILNKYLGSPLDYNLPEIKLNHLKKMTDDVGLIQFCKLATPDIVSGYTLDDNARAMVAMLMHYELFSSPDDLVLIERYLALIEHCQQPDGKFLNYVDKDKGFHEMNHHMHLDDSNARALWGLGCLISYADILPPELVERARGCFDRSFVWMGELQYLRSAAIAIKGLYHYHLKYPDKKLVSMISILADRLVKKYTDVAESEWLWFEDFMSYANTIMPEALLYAYLVTKNRAYKEIAKESFDFLLSHIFMHNTIRVVSNKWWFQKGKDKNIYGEQPIEVSYMIQALRLFYQVFRDENYREKIDIAFSWFMGNNHLGRIIYNPATGGCYDGLEQDSVNLNQGAESTICYLIARLTIEKANMEKIYILREDYRVAVK